MGTAMPLWHPGQPWWLITAIGVGCGALMAATVAALTGLAAARIEEHGHGPVRS
jgi:tetrahydromethanopterin S-methyltransferase subunit D